MALLSHLTYKKILKQNHIHVRNCDNDLYLAFQLTHLTHKLLKTIHYKYQAIPAKQYSNFTANTTPCHIASDKARHSMIP